MSHPPWAKPVGFCGPCGGSRSPGFDRPIMGSVQTGGDPMSKTHPSPLSGIRDVLVGVTVESDREEASSAIGYGLTLAKAAGAHLTVQSAAWRLSGDDVW